MGMLWLGLTLCHDPKKDPDQHSQCGISVGCYSRIRMLTSQWSLLKLLLRSLLLQDVPGHPGKGHCRDCMVVEKLNS